MDLPPWTTESGSLRHDMLRPGTVEDRAYQTAIAEACLGRDSLVVIPTGLGKTVIAALVLAERLRETGGKALFLAPSRPLADQHADSLRSVLATDSVACLTGTESPRTRAGRWGSRRILTATPQVALNDLRQGWLPRDLSLVVFDEAHRAVGDYAYVALARELRARYPSARFLGLTASPGHEAEHVEEVCRNLFIESVVLRSREDPDVAPYVQAMDIEWIEVQPSEILTKVSGYVTTYLHERLNQIRKYGFLRDRKNVQVRIQDLNAASAQAFARRHAGGAPYLFQASRQISLARMAQHALLCVEREGVDAFLKFLEPKLKPGRAKIDASFVNDERIARAYKAARRWKGPSHPKLEPLVRVVSEQIASKPDAKVIVFAELRDTVDFLVGLFRSQGVKVERFTGQGTRQGRKGMSQKQQHETLARFGSGGFPVLAATSIAEEGLDVPQVDLVVFYEPVASDVRLIQRKGRTGRDAPGKVVILTTDKTADERYLWAGMRRERRMKRLVRKLASVGVQGPLKDGTPTAADRPPETLDAGTPDAGRGQRTLTDFGPSPP